MSIQHYESGPVLCINRFPVDWNVLWVESTDTEGSYSHSMRRARVKAGHYELSIIFGSMTYSDNYGHPYADDDDVFHEEVSCVEIAVYSDGRMLPLGDDDADDDFIQTVAGYIPVKSLEPYIRYLATLHSGRDRVRPPIVEEVR
jgi:hypothetical protein